MVFTAQLLQLFCRFENIHNKILEEMCKGDIFFHTENIFFIILLGNVWQKFEDHWVSIIAIC